MKALKCPSCSGNLKIPEGKDIVYCMYCGNQIKVREIIYFDKIFITNQEREIDSNQLLTSAISLIEMEDTQTAEEMINKVLEREAGNSLAECYKGIVIINSSYGDLKLLKIGLNYINAGIAKINVEEKSRFLKILKKIILPLEFEVKSIEYLEKIENEILQNDIDIIKKLILFYNQLYCKFISDGVKEYSNKNIKKEFYLSKLEKISKSIFYQMRKKSDELITKAKKGRFQKLYPIKENFELENAHKIIFASIFISLLFLIVFLGSSISKINEFVIGVLVILFIVIGALLGFKITQILSTNKAKEIEKKITGVNIEDIWN